MQRLSRVGLISVGLVGVSSLVGGLVGSSVVAGSSQVGDRLRSYAQLMQTIQDEYVEETKSERLIASSIGGMLHTLDPHSDFLEPREHSQLQERQRGSYYGLGISVQAIEGNITVISPFEGSPAHRLGIRAGDIISRIDDGDARGMSIDEAVRRLKGPKGTSVKVTITRRGYDAPLEFTVIRDEIPLHAVPYSFMVTPRTGYVRLPAGVPGHMRERAGAGHSYAQGPGRELADPRHSRQPWRLTRPVLRCRKPLLGQGPARRLHARPHGAR